MKTLLVLNPENATPAEYEKYPVREAVRAVLLDEKGNVGLAYVARDKYYKIPGGGIEKGEDKIMALKRECLEEIGCEVEVISEIGKIVEYRKMFNLTQISYCYFVRLIGNKGTPNYMEDEKEEGFEPLWTSYVDAINKLSNNSGLTKEARFYMVPRDLKFLKSAKKFLE